MSKTGFADPRDGKIYRTAEIGGQTWMAENMDFDCPGSKCYGNDPKNAEEYGRLYDWETAMKICPAGWHLPSRSEYEALDKAVGGEKVAGKKLRTKRGWGLNYNGTNEYGFKALAGGFGFLDGSFHDIGLEGYWWSAREYDSNNAYFRYIVCGLECVYWNYVDKGNLFSVRYIKD